MIDLDLMIAETEQVPALPETATRLSSLFSGEEWDLDDVVGAVRLDPVLVGRVLRNANSALSGSAVEIKDVDNAVMRVGTGTVLALAFGATTRSRLSSALPCFGLEKGRIWRHSVATSAAIDCARRKLRGAVPPEASAAAVLHDLGLLPLSAQAGEKVVELLRRAKSEGGRSGRGAELEILGAHHGEVGGLIARRWRLPESMVEAIVHHHSPDDAPSEEGRRLAWFVAFADHVALEIGVGLDDADIVDTDRAEVLERVGLDAEGFEAVCDATRESLDELLALYE